MKTTKVDYSFPYTGAIERCPKSGQQDSPLGAKKEVSSKWLRIMQSSSRHQLAFKPAALSLTWLNLSTESQACQKKYPKKYPLHMEALKNDVSSHQPSTAQGTQSSSPSECVCVCVHL